MWNASRAVQSFPSVQIPSESGGLAVEICLIAQIGHGAGDHLFTSVAQRQKAHTAFVDELDEPSAKLGGTDFRKGDFTSLYSFVVGPNGHPFHRHVGHRIFTAVSGSGGAQLRFSTASAAQIEQDPHNFVRALRYVNIPADSLFTVRFGGETWHQFAPLASPSRHPVFFALSCHTNELGGDLSEAMKQQVISNQASIPSLTVLLPHAVSAMLASAQFKAQQVPTTGLSLDAPAGTVQGILCGAARRVAGWARGAWAAGTKAAGYLSYSGESRKVKALSTPPIDSLLRAQLATLPIHHDDTFSMVVTSVDCRQTKAASLLVAVLEGFLHNAPTGVSSLMAFRNLLVKPLGLRTSPLGCPVSSLLSPDKSKLFAGRYPVLDQARSDDERHAQVILGADDKHLMFRSCVSVKVLDEHQVEVTLGTRVHCKNAFGRFYMAAIDLVHRRYVTPSMLRLAVEYAVTHKSTDERTLAVAAG